MLPDNKASGTACNALIPIVIGVAGHRDLRKEDLEPLRARTREIFENIRKSLPNSPIVLLAALAEGADRLVARVALEFDAELIVPIPMPIDECRKDFTDAASGREFDELLRRSKHYFVLPFVGGATLESIASNQKDRDKQYAQLAAYIAHHSQILIALWDGVDSKKLGGTSDKVTYKLLGIPGQYPKSAGLMSQVESGPIYHILTPRISNPHPAGELFGIKKIYPEYWGSAERAERAYVRVLRYVDRYNSDVKRHGSRLEEKACKSKRAIIPADKENSLEVDCRSMLDRYSLADVLAEKFKRRRLAIIKLLFFLVVAAFFFFQLHVGFYLDYPEILIVYSLFMLAAALIYGWAKRSDIECKHEDYRALADAMRVQFFWKYVGIDDDAADHYLHKHKGELEWIRYAIRAWSIPTCTASSCQPGNYGIAFNCWVDRQREYFVRRAGEDRRNSEHLHRISKILFVFGLVLVACLIVIELQYRLHGFLGTAYGSVRADMILLIGMSLAIAAALQGYVEKVVLTEESKQYERMAGLYRMAADRIEKALADKEYDEARSLYRELGKEALIENGDWLLLHRARPLEVPSV